MSTTVTGASIIDGQPTQVTTYTKKTILNNAQILSLYSTPIEVVPAAGEGTLLVLVNAQLVGKFSGGNYFNIAGAYFEIAYQVGDTTTNSLGVTTFNGDNRVGTLIHSSEDEAFAYDNVVNKSLVLQLNAIQDLGGTEGTENNTLEVTVLYYIINI